MKESDKPNDQLADEFAARCIAAGVPHANEIDWGHPPNQPILPVSQPDPSRVEGLVVEALASENAFLQEDAQRLRHELSIEHDKNTVLLGLLHDAQAALIHLTEGIQRRNDAHERRRQS